MKKGILLASAILIAFVMQAQNNSLSPVGEYYLQGIMETASGFKLNADSSFEFFFSYGAIDRSGQGNWKRDGDVVILNSPPKKSQDFSLLIARKMPGNGIHIQLSGGNEYLNLYVTAVVNSGTKSEAVVSNQNGRIIFKTDSVDTIELLFELCPDKYSVFKIDNKTANYFEFNFEPSLMDVLFHNFRLQLHPDKLTGPHPVLKEKIFTYQKTANKLSE